MKPRTKFTDPDFRRNPKTNQWCAICQKDIIKPEYYIHLIDGCLALHPEDESLFNPNRDGEDYGHLPIGSCCAKKLGLEWATKVN